MEKNSRVSEKTKLFIGVMALQFCFAGFHIVSRAALNMGVSKVVFPVYRNAIALVLLAPFAYFLEKKDRPPLTFSLLAQFFLLALCGITANQGFYLLGLYYVSPIYASAIQNTTPAITFVLAAVLRLEQVNTNKRHGLAKIVGTVVSIVGATVITLYKGPPLLSNKLHTVIETITSSDQILNWTLGCVYLVGNCLAWSGWMVLQVPVLKQYPARLSVTAITCFFGLIQFLTIAAFTENDTERWIVQSGEELFTILYAGLVASGISFSLQIWCIDRGGPLFVAVFQPVQTVLVTILSSIILGDRLYSGGPGPRPRRTRHWPRATSTEGATEKKVRFSLSHMNNTRPACNNQNLVAMIVEKGGCCSKTEKEEDDKLQSGSSELASSVSTADRWHETEKMKI